MAENIITIQNLCKSYKNHEVLRDFNLNIERGHICGLIGPNGAGKTTIMKILAGEIFQSKGEICLFGDNKDLDKSRAKMSFMIEYPIVSGSMSAYENLEYIYHLRGYHDRARIDEVLEIVGLKDVGQKMARKFSLGMKQRLGIGMALLTKPEVMVLDEPVNGLDPEGIVEVRKLIKRMQEEWNITVLIYSHLLSELSELCTDFSIINKGQLVENISQEQLLAKCKQLIVLQTNNLETTKEVLTQKLSINNFEIVDNELHVLDNKFDIAQISKAITSEGLIITKLLEENQSLEDYYLKKVGGQA